MELGQAGCVAGEVVPVKISIRHCKVVRSVHGIIVTLYRQARTDMHPHLPLGPADKKGDVKFEDYYPRSRTGLGGMSLSAAGSSQVWRKDLSQTFAPLYIDQQTMSTEVKVAIRVPDGVFPTIRNAPGEMISFRYFVEVIIDIHGRLAKQDRGFPSLHMMTMQTPFTDPLVADGADDRPPNAVTTWGHNCIDTTQIRREKNAVTCLCDLIIGTVGSVRAQGKRRNVADVRDETSSDLEFGGTSRSSQQTIEQFRGRGSQRASPNEQDRGIDSEPCNGYEPYDYDNETYPSSPPTARISGVPSPYIHAQVVPPRDALGEDHLPEKERLRRAEARLMPSQPPVVPGYPRQSSDGHIDGDPSTAPSAPALPEEVYHGPPSYRRRAFAAEMDRAGGSAPLRPSADMATGMSHGNASPPILADDKMELERRRLQLQASEPPARAQGQLRHGCRSEATEGETTEASAPTAWLADRGDGIVQEIQAPGYGGDGTGLGESGAILTSSPSAGEERLPRYET